MVADAKHIARQLSHSELKQKKQDYLYKDNYDGYTDAVFYYVFNRLCFGGIIHTSHIKEFYCKHGTLYRRQKEHSSARRDVLFPLQKAWKHINNLPIQVEQSDFVESLNRHPDIFAYLDPPYYGTEDLYTQKSFDHIQLRHILSNREGWILSYNDCAEIREMYAQYRMVDMQGTNFVKGKPTYRELFIFSDDLVLQPEPQQLRLGNF